MTRTLLHRFQRPLRHRHAAQGAVGVPRRGDASRIYGADHPAAGGAALSGPDRSQMKPRACSTDTHGAADPLQRGRALGRFLQQAVLADPGSGGAAAARRASSIWCATGARSPAPISTSWATNVTTTAPPRFCRRISTIRRVPAPPPEKKYWWPVPRRDDPPARRFPRLRPVRAHLPGTGRRSTGWSWRSWRSCRRRAALFVRLEDLQRSPQRCEGFIDFLNLPYRDEHFAAFARPHNVNRPEDRLLDAAQRAQFDAIAGDDDGARWAMPDAPNT